MRAVITLLTVPFADKYPQMNEFLTQIRSNLELASMFEVFRRIHQPRHLTPL
ncbi:hypothetical protein ACJMK2_001039 [Sinanodonta woodiana]|uniref:Androgen receptor n=1 Tax=Sinanodonta woodiana TaxID=1069815 RepID=A0ABD3XST0_SINWO